MTVRELVEILETLSGDMEIKACGTTGPVWSVGGADIRPNRSAVILREDDGGDD